MRVRYSKPGDIAANPVKPNPKTFGKTAAAVLVSAALLAGCAARNNELLPATPKPIAEKSVEDGEKLFTSAIPSFPKSKKKSSFITIETPVVDAKSDAWDKCQEKKKELVNELPSAIENGDKQKVKDLLENGVGVDSKISTLYDDTPLTLAISKGHTEIVKLLLEYGADADYRTSEYDDTPLMLAARKGYTEIIKLLLEYGADINESKLLNSGKSALIVAADYGFTDIVEILLENGADPNVLDAEKSSCSVSIGVRVLISPDRTHERAINGWSALMYAAWAGDAEMVELLINAGADVNIRAKHSKDETALMVASEAGHPEIVELLIDAGADVDAVGDGYTALVYAVEYGKLDVIKVLIEKGGADVNPEISKCFTLFKFAADKETKDLLLKYGARCDCCCNK